MVREIEQLPRSALVWTIMAQALLLLPHAPHIPAWVIVVYLLAFAWRVQAFRGRIELPGRWLKVALSGAAAGGILLSFGSLLGMEPMVAFLLTAFALKLTEMRSRKDAYVVIFLGYFVCLTAFLLSQGLAMVLYGLLVVWILTTALISVHRPTARVRDTRSLRLAGVMMLQATPLMLVLFFLFPRIGPLWNVPLRSHTAETGMSDTLFPGDVSKLSQSDEVAFRVQFDGAVPSPEKLYWRGVVMSRLDATVWRGLKYFEIPPALRREPDVVLAGDPLRYSIIMEPTQQNWLYSLRYARPEKPRLMSLSDFRLYSPADVEYRLQYRVQSWPDALLEPDLDPWRRRAETQLPPGENPRARALAEDLYRTAGSPAEFVNAALAHFRRQPFFYTLRAPLLGDRDVMDRFLFETRRGFCEHYAYAFAVMARSVGIPTRIVAGYQGGEVNPVNGTVIVHQFDAHAWNEVWLAGRGWVRVDPTAAVAPNRILYGLEQAVAEEGSFLASSPWSPLRFRGINLINSLRLQYDALTYRWQSWITGFDGATQVDLLRRVLGEVSPSRSVLLVMGTGLATMVMVSWFLLRNRGQRRRSAYEQELVNFRNTIHRRGVEPRAGETPAQLAERAAQRWPSEAEQIRALYRAHAALVYGHGAGTQDAARTVRELRRRLRALALSRR